MKETVDLTKRGKKSFSITSDETNCSLHGGYFTHDYSGFNSHWKLISDGYFTLELKEKDFDIKVSAGYLRSLQFTVIYCSDFVTN